MEPPEGLLANRARRAGQRLRHSLGWATGSPQIAVLRALRPLFGGIWGLIEGSWVVLVEASVKEWPFGFFFEVLDHCFTYFWGPGTVSSFALHLVFLVVVYDAFITFQVWVFFKVGCCAAL